MRGSLDLLRRLTQSVMITGAYYRLRERFIERADHGMLIWPKTSQESACLDSAIRSALHIYGCPRTDSMSAEAFGQAAVYVDRELTAVRWILENPNYAKSVAEKKLTDQHELQHSIIGSKPNKPQTWNE